MQSDDRRRQKALAVMDWPVRPMELPGRGMGLVAVRDIAPGEIVMQEEPLILYPNELNLSTVCGSCLRMLEGTGSAQPQQAAGPCLACGIRCDVVAWSILMRLQREIRESSPRRLPAAVQVLLARVPASSQ